MGRGRKAEEDDDLALCIVCDIRGFTAMQTRVHELVFESVKHRPHEAEIISKAYRQYVESSQRRAHKKLVVPLENSKLGQGRYVVKSTGDGYMVAVSVPREDDGEFGNSVDCIRTLIAAAYDLASESELCDGGKGGVFADLTKDFLEKHGDQIGFHLEHVLKETEHHHSESKNPAAARNSRFRVAVGVSLGFATFIEPQRGFTPASPQAQNVAARLREVSGYGVNLAFRLCDHAGRGYELGDERCTPPVLLDRRIGRALLGDFKRRRLKVVPWHEPLKLKGIDEGWAYYLESF